MVAKLLLQLLSHTTLEQCCQWPSVSLVVTSIMMMSPSSPEEGAVLRIDGMALQGALGRTGRKEPCVVSQEELRQLSDRGWGQWRLGLKLLPSTICLHIFPSGLSEAFAKT